MVVRAVVDKVVDHIEVAVVPLVVVVVVSPVAPMLAAVLGVPVVVEMVVLVGWAETDVVVLEIELDVVVLPEAHQIQTIHCPYLGVPDPAVEAMPDNENLALQVLLDVHHVLT